MKRILKVFLIVIAGLLLFLALGLTVLVVWVNPNRFKPLIVEGVKEATGRELIMQGDMAWTLYPALGVKVGHLELSNPPHFNQKTFAEMDSATISVRWWPLLRGKVKSNGIFLKGLKVHFIKNSEGKTNWQDLTPSDPKPVRVISESPSYPARKASFNLNVSAVDISDAEFTFENEQNQSVLLLKNIEIHAKNINFIQPFPWEIAFTMTGRNPNLQGEIKIKTHVSLNMEKEIFLLNKLNVTAKLTKENVTYRFDLTGDVATDLIRQTLQVDNFIANLDDLSLQGKINVTQLSKSPLMRGHLILAPFNVKKGLEKAGKDTSSIKTFGALSGELDFTSGLTLASTHLTGVFKVDDIETTKIHLTALNTNAQFDKGVLTLSPFNAIFYEGSIQGEGSLNLNPAVPALSLQAKLMNVQAEPLFADLAKLEKLKFSGVGNANIQIKTAGLTGDLIAKNLNGTADFNVNNGVLKGIDIGYLIDSAAAIAHKKEMPSQDTHETPFGTLTAKAIINNGVITSQEFKLTAPRFESSGEGYINLVARKINFLLQTSIKQSADTPKNNLSNLYGYALPIKIYGDLSDPSIKLDMEKLMKTTAAHHLEKAREQLQNKFKNKLPENTHELINHLLGT